jgi:hypothetical protein
MRDRTPKMLDFLGLAPWAADEENKAQKLPDVPGTGKCICKVGRGQVFIQVRL